MKPNSPATRLTWTALIACAAALAAPVASGDTITNAVIAITGTEADDVLDLTSPTNASAVQVFTTNAPRTTLSEATGVAGLGGHDRITAGADLSAGAEATVDIPSGNFDYRGKEAIAVGTGIAGNAGQDAITNAATLTSTATARLDVGEVFSTIIFGVTGLPSEADALSTGIAGGDDLDTIINHGTTIVSANATSSVTKVRISSLEIPVEILGLGDARTVANSTALGLSGGTNGLSGSGPQSLENHGTLAVQAGADASAWQLAIELVGAARIDDATTASSLATGMAGDASDDSLSHFGTMNVEALSHAELTSTELKMKGLLIKGIFDLFGADVGKINTAAEAHALGLDGGAGNDYLLNAQTNGVMSVHSRAEAETTASTISVSPPTGGGETPPAPAATIAALANALPAVDGTNGSSGTDYAKADTKARALATGLSGGTGNDTIENRGGQKSFAEAYADSLGIAADLSLSKENNWPIPGAALVNASTSAQAEAAGLDGGEGNDTLLNSGTIESRAQAEGDSTTVGVTLKGSVEGFNIGITVTDASSEAVGAATGIAGGAGDDAITNTGAIYASTTNKDSSVAVSVAIQGDKTGIAAGVSLADATTVARGTVTGIDGGTGNDVIHNAGSVSANGFSESDSVGVGVSFSGSLEGIAAGVTVTDTSSHATNVAAGISDIGGDTTVNTGTIGASATARGDSDAISVSLAGAKAGLAVGVAVADASTITRAEAYGIDLGQEIATNGFLGDTVLNSGSVAARAASTNSALALSIAIAAAAQGVTGGAAVTKGDATAQAVAAGVRTGSGNDLVVSDGPGSLTADASARASTASVAVTLSGAAQGLTLGAALADATTTADAWARGIETGAGNDTIVNGTALTNRASTDVDSTSVATTISFAWQGVSLGASLADSTTRATATATGINAGADNDVVTNSAAVVTAANADANAKSIAVTIAVAPEGVSAGVALARSGTESTATATGLTGGAGDDFIANSSRVDVDAVAKTKVHTIAVNIATFGAGVVDVSATAAASAMGLEGGSGIDWLQNSGAVDVAANSTNDATSAAANFAGYASGNVRLTNTATAVGLQSASPTDAQAAGETVHNTTNGSVNVLAHAVTDSSGYVIQGGGAQFAEVGAIANATATGIAGSQGGDTIFNEGTNRATASTKVDASNANFQLLGVQLGFAGLNASSTATGIEGGAGTNTIVNGASGLITATAGVDTLAANMNAGFGLSFGLSGVTADAQARGIRTGTDADLIQNFGRINATAAAEGEAAAGSIGLFSLNLSSSLASVIAEGINAGGGDDWIYNAGSITAGQAQPGVTNLARANSEAISMDFWSISLASLGAKAQVAGIAGAGGNDTVVNAGNIAAGDANNWLAWGEAFAFGGQILGIADAIAGSEATGTAAGVDGGDGADLMFNASNGVINVDARSGTHVSSMTYEFAGFLIPSAAESDAEATSTAAGFQGGAGADQVGNAGLIDVQAYALASAEADSEITFDLDTAALATSYANATATAAGIDLGAGTNYAENSGTINAAATAQARGYAVSDAEFESTDSEVYSRPVASAWGILGGNDGNMVRNTTNGSITATAFANTTDPQGNVSYANSDSGRDATGVAGSESHAPIAANATGIGTGSGADWIFNDGHITANARADGVVSANTHVWYRYPQADALSFVAATAKGIAAGAGSNLVVNNGQITVTGWGNATNSAHAWSRDYRATANSVAYVNGVATGIEADGVVTNTAAGIIDVTARATSYSEANTRAEHTWAIANLNALAIGIATASGGSAPAPDRVVNNGTLRVTASAGENAGGAALYSTFADTDLNVTSCDAHGCSTSAVHAVGISLGNRGATVVNDSTIDVTGRSRAYAWADAHSRDVHPNAIAIGSADALAHGIQTGNGNNWIANYGTIAVTAYSTVGLWVDTEDNDDEYRTSAAWASTVGIQTGSGNDTIINGGSILTTNRVGNTITAGIAIDAGAGNDTVALLDGSYVRGDIRLGTGNDTLELTGTSLTAGAVDAGAGTDALTLVGAGNLASGSGFSGFEQLVKTGDGTFILPPITTMQQLVIEDGALQFNGGYQFGTNSTFESWLDKSGDCGRLQVMGHAGLAGSLTVRRGAGPFQLGTTAYDLILGSTGVSGIFSSTNLPTSSPLLSFQVHYLSDRMQLQIKAQSFATYAHNTVERSVGGYLDRLLPGSSGDLAKVLDTIQQLPLSELSIALTSLSPDSYDAYTLATHRLVRQYNQSAQQRLNTLRLNAAATTGNLRDAFVPGQNPVLLASAGSAEDLGGVVVRRQQRETARPSGVWAGGFGQWSSQDSEDGYTGFDYSPWGFAVGYDQALSDAVTLGLSAAYASTHVTLDDQRGDGDFDTYSGSAYGSWMKDNLHFEGVLSYGYNDYDNHRNLVIDGTASTATSDHTGHALGTLVSGGYVWQLKHWALEPFASLQYTFLSEDSFQETGAGSVSLAVGDRQTQALVTELGLRLAHVFKKERFTFIPEVSAAWNYDCGIDDRAITASFAGSPGVTFTMPGSEVEPNGLTTSAAATFLFGKGISSSIRYNSELRENYYSHGVSGELRFSF